MAPMLHEPAAQSVINHLRILHTNETATAVRLRLSARLDQVALRSAQLSPAAILLVRTLADPLAGRFHLGNRTRYVDQQWARAVRHALDEKYRHAVRPHQGHIAPTAEAVLFCDEAELLACLALDLARGEAQSRWWWQAILRQRQWSGHSAIGQIFAQQVAQTPAILFLLAEWQTVTDVLAVLSPGEVSEIFARLVQSYQVADFRVAAPESSGLAAHERSTRRQPFSAAESRSTVAAAERMAPVAPWQSWLAGLPLRTLTPAPMALLGLALTLYHRPTVAQQASFTQAARLWWQHTSVPGQPVTAPADGATQPPAANRRNQQVTTAAPSQQEEGEAWSAWADSQSAQGQVDEMDQHQPPALPQTGRNEQHESDVVPQKGGSLGSAERGRAQSRLPAVHLAPPTAAEADLLSARKATAVTIDYSGVQQQVTAESDALVTAVGGVLYLINVIERLQLFAYFDESWGQNVPLGPWGLLALLGRGLLVTTDAAYLADPIWPLLAQLDGQALPTVDGEQVAPAHADWRPPTWAATLPAVPPADEPALSGPLTDGLRSDLYGWLIFVLPFLRSWFRQQMMQEGRPVETAFLHRLLCVHGRLFVTTSHVDLVLRLDQINLAARLQGLDQDPGWLPHWGRVIKFHFEG